MCDFIKDFKELRFRNYTAVELVSKLNQRQMNKGHLQSIIKEHPRANSAVAQLPCEPQELTQDEHLNEIIASLKALGHDVQIQKNCFKDSVTFEPLYYSSFIVEGIGEFNAISKKSKLDANLIAAGKLKTYWSDFANINEEDGSCDSEIDFTSTECSFSSEFSISIKDKVVLSPCDLKWIELINSFNSVYEPTKDPISTIEELISRDPVSFQIISNFDFPRAIYSTTVKNENLGTFTGEGESQSKSRVTALTEIFDQLRKLSGLFSCFKSHYPSGINFCLTRMEVFLSMNKELISVHVLLKSQLLYQASIILGKLKHFEAIANNKEEARIDAYIEMIEYLQLYCERIEQTNFVSNFYDRFGSHDRCMRGGFRGNRPGYTYQRPPGSKVPELPTSMCNSLIELIINFTKVNDGQLSAKMVMAKLMQIDGSVFETEQIKSCDKIGYVPCKDYQVTFKFISAVFTGVAIRESLANDKVLLAVYKRLLSMSNLFTYFRREYYPKIPVHDFKLQIATHHDEVFKLKIRKHRIGFEATITLVHFCDFQGVSNNFKDAEEIAFKKFVEYMLVLIERFPKTKDELSKEQKQIAISNPNGVANIVENGSELSFDGMKASKGAQNSNEAVKRT